MPRLRAIALLLLLLTAAPTPASWTEAELQRILEVRLGEYQHTIGMVIAYWDGEQAVVAGHGVYGKSDPRVPDGDTLFEIGSVTKVFTASLLSEMVRNGEVALKDPAQKYMPEGVKLPEKSGRPITLLQLATHDAGLPKMPDNIESDDWRNPYANYTLEEMYEFLEQVKLGRNQEANSISLTLGPANFAVYSNLGLGLLGEALANQAGVSYGPLIQQRVTGPLGMADTVIEMNAGQSARLATGHNWGAYPEPPLEMPTMQGAVALRSTANDLILFLRANLASQKASPLPALQDTHKPYKTTNSGIAGKIGLGWLIRTSDARRIHWHNGTTKGHRAFIGFCNKTGEAAVVLTNSMQDLDGLGLGLLEPGIRLRRLLR